LHRDVIGGDRCCFFFMSCSGYFDGGVVDIILKESLQNFFGAALLCNRSLSGMVVALGKGIME
jgi:hypothetical protein